MTRLLARLIGLALSLACAGALWAQAYPAKTVKLVVPFAAGSLTDAVARLLAEELGKTLGAQFIVDNRPGASGIIGADLVAKSPPDGYTLMITSNTPQAANLSLFKQLPYHPLKDFTPLARLGYYPFVLVTTSSLPVKTVAELLAYAKANPGKLSYATSNSMSLVSAETIKALAGIDVVGVPYKSNPQALADVMSGQVQLMIADLGSSKAHIAANKLRALGVTPAKRTRLMPELVSISEGGLKSFDLSGWAGIVAPAGLPKPVLDTLSQTLQKLLARKDLQERMAMTGIEIAPLPPAEFGRFIEHELDVWAARVKAAGIPPE